jgi:lipopolysaccharide transport system permease protein
VLYQRSWLGFGWAIASPLLQLVVFVVIFRRVLIVPVENYASSVFMGVLVWGWFHASLVQSTTLITGNQALVRQPRFPLALLPHVTVGVRLFHFALAMPILLALMWWQGVRPCWPWLSLPFLLVVEFALIAGIAYPLAALNVRLRDTQHMTAVTLQLLMYLTPIFYSLESIPARLRPWLFLNPMVGLVESWRTVLLRGQWPDPGILSALAVLAAALLLIGRRIFVVQSHRFVEEL